MKISISDLELRWQQEIQAKHLIPVCSHTGKDSDHLRLPFFPREKRNNRLFRTTGFILGKRRFPQNVSNG